MRASALVPPQIAALSEQALAQESLANGDAAAAREHAVLALRASPMETGAIGNLGTSKLAAGLQDDAFDAMRFGQALGWRDTSVQAYLFEQAMANDDAIRAALHLDALLRTRPGDAELRSAIDRVLALDGGTAAILGRIQERPRWRSAVLGELKGLGPETLERRARLVERAIGSAAIGCQEASSFTAFVRRSGRSFASCEAPAGQ